MLNDFELRQQIEEIASQFKIFECVLCAEAIKQALIDKGVHGKHLKLFTGSTEDPFGNIYHEILRQNISVNGRHEAISVVINNGEFIFDNIHPQGIFLRRNWLDNFYIFGKDMGRDFQITEIDF